MSDKDAFCQDAEKTKSTIQRFGTSISKRAVNLVHRGNTLYPNSDVFDYLVLLLECYHVSRAVYAKSGDKIRPSVHSALDEKVKL